MINVLFFAKLREDVGMGFIELPAAGLRNIADVVKALGVAKGERMAEALMAKNIIVAINHEVADFTAAVHDGDEVAFYPPVSGG
jgi:sulfur-carrier protein